MNSVTEATDSSIDTAMPRKRARMKRMFESTGSRFSRSSGSIANRFGRRWRTHTAITARTIATAVNMEVTMPRPMVTAKPRTGPDPNQNRSSVAINVVTFESTIVWYALEPEIERRGGAPSPARLLLDALVDQHVGVDGEPDAQYDAGD